MTVDEVKDLLDKERQRHIASVRSIWQSMQGTIEDLQREFKYHDCIVERIQSELEVKPSC